VVVRVGVGLLVRGDVHDLGDLAVPVAPVQPGVADPAFFGGPCPERPAATVPGSGDVTETP
jgi:hypothetical protein